METEIYRDWLGLAESRYPPHAYQLLGVPLWTDDSDTIARAARQQMQQARRHAGSEHPEQLRQLIGEIIEARDLLVGPASREKYNTRLRRRLARQAAQPTLELGAAAMTGKMPRIDSDGAAVGTASQGVEEARDQPRISQGESSGAAAAAVQKAGGDVERRRGGWRRILTPNRAAISVARFVVAVVVAAVAINLIFFRSPSSPGTTDAGAVEAGRSHSVVDDGSESPGVAQPLAAKEPAATERDAQAADLADGAKLVPQPPRQAADLQGSPVVAPVPTAPLKSAAAGQPAGRDLAKVTLRALPEFSQDDDRRLFVKTLRDMLYEGFGSGAAALEQGTALFQQAQALSNKEPRLGFGYGLVLWKHLRFTEALAQFEQAASLSDDPYWPARQALIRLNLMRGEQDAAFDHLAEMTHQLQKRRGDSVTDGDRACAVWMGRLLGYLQQPANRVRPDADRVETARGLALRLLRGELRESYLAGERGLRDDFEAMTTTTEEQLAKLSDRAEKKSAEERERLEEKMELRKDRKEQIERTAGEWRDWIKQQTTKLDAELKTLSDQFSDLYGQAQGIDAAIGRLNAEIITLERANVEQNPREQLRKAQAIASKAATRDQLQAQYTVLDRRATVVRHRAAAVAQSRAAAVNRYQQATGELIEQSDALRKWNGILQQRRREIEKSESAKSPKANAVLRKARALSTYLPFNRDQERQRLLDSLPVE